MFTKLLLLFIGVPLVEILILIKLGELMGFWPTIWLVIVTGILGASLARAQGLRVWLRIQEELRRGELPAEEMVNGLLIFCAGLVLLTPGLLTDLAGFFLLIPISRRLITNWIKRKFEKMARSHQASPAFLIDGEIVED